jgi:hypothetical protein
MPPSARGDADERAVEGLDWKGADRVDRVTDFEHFRAERVGRAEVLARYDGPSLEMMSVRCALQRYWKSRAALLHTQKFDGVTFAFFETDFVSKASFMLAPALKETVSREIGWPVLAIAPSQVRPSLHEASALAAPASGAQSKRGGPTAWGPLR